MHHNRRPLDDFVANQRSYRQTNGFKICDFHDIDQ